MGRRGGRLGNQPPQSDWQGHIECLGGPQAHIQASEVLTGTFLSVVTGPRAYQCKQRHARVYLGVSVGLLEVKVDVTEVYWMPRGRHLGDL